MKMDEIKTNGVDFSIGLETPFTGQKSEFLWTDGVEVIILVMINFL